MSDTTMSVWRRRRRRAARRALVLAVVGAALVPTAAMAVPADGTTPAARGHGARAQDYRSPDVRDLASGGAGNAAGQRLNAQAQYYASLANPKATTPIATQHRALPAQSNDGNGSTTLVLALIGGLLAVATAAALTVARRMRGGSHAAA